MISIASLITILTDYLFLYEFQIESVFLLAAVALLLVNFARQFNQNAWLNLPLGIATSSLITLISIYSFYILLITLFGYGFTGRPIQIIWIFMSILNISLVIVTLIDLGDIIRWRRFLSRQK